MNCQHVVLQILEYIIDLVRRRAVTEPHTQTVLNENYLMSVKL
jgi:hypothetical protein